MPATLPKILELLPAIPAFRMVGVPGTERFMMGGDRYDSEKPVHPVKITDFHIGQFPVTQALWKWVMGNNPSFFRGDDRPVEQVSWNDIREKDGFLDRLNAKAEIRQWLIDNQMNGMAFRLPSEAEWEYAARGGPGREQGYEYAGSNTPGAVVWYDDNSHGETKPVGLKAPNALGLYDMSGNVWEWCEDDWHDRYKDAPHDGSAWVDNPERAQDRVIRGGSWYGLDAYCRVAYRIRHWPESVYRDNGLRLVLSVQHTEKPVA